MTTSVAALIIGNEILTGKTVDENGPFLVKELRRLGSDLQAILVVPDTLDAIASGVRLLAPEVGALVTSGGVGPTHDDVTFEGVALAFGLALERNSQMERLIRDIFDPKARPASLRMADLPGGAELIHSDSLRSPVVKVRNVYILPGVPSLFRRKFQAISERFRHRPYVLKQLELVCEEADIADTLRGLLSNDAELLIGSYPRFDQADHSLKVTIEARQRERVERALASLLEQIPAGWVKGVSDG